MRKPSTLPLHLPRTMRLPPHLQPKICRNCSRRRYFLIPSCTSVTRSLLSSQYSPAPYPLFVCCCRSSLNAFDVAGRYFYVLYVLYSRTMDSQFFILFSLFISSSLFCLSLQNSARIFPLSLSFIVVQFKTSQPGFAALPARENTAAMHVCLHWATALNF